MKYIVQVDKISKSYGKVLAVDGISFMVKEGDFFSILGPSGCGKTTILRILGGFINQDTGTVLIDGKDMKGIPPNRRDTTMVFQNLALFPHMNVRENIIYGLKKRKFPERRIREELANILDIVNLKGFGSRRISELSGGQQQRVALARSLIVKPRILLLDEPLASLDKKLRISMQGELKAIQRKIGTTFLYVTHDQSEALTMSDNIAVMDEGSIIQAGSPDVIYNCPESMFVADFIGAGNFIPVSSVKRNGRILIMQTRKGGKILLRNDFKKQCDYKRGKEKTVKFRGEIVPPVFFIRPEKIRISGRQKEGKNRFKGKINSTVFEGPDIKLGVDSEELGEIRIEIKNVGSLPDFKQGSNILFYWDYTDGILLEY
jgi:spermidine/putrescine transport system ATP-binding protein